MAKQKSKSEPAAGKKSKPKKSPKSQVRVRREGDTVIVSVPVKFYRRKGRQAVLTSLGSDTKDSETLQDVNSTFVSLLAKAYAWQDELESGEHGTFEEVVDAKKVGRTYAGRILRLTSLCPEIVESIVNGDESYGLSLRQLHKGIPIGWNQQLTVFSR
ncbi:MAG TPA: hypothetical protein PKD64_09555 [Pirellulaceae bacterium]|nr:hypothetical protein [Pirellulaceae bacterium]HMO92432.1 hypothetical protein [Pirellulaceae bacterium]HMP67898.1 hypothetical protein [Pirellulaceae bacterium]